MKLKKIIGTKLKNIRLKRNLTIQVLAESSRVSSNMISRIERGLTIPSVEILMKLATVFDKSINYFVEEVSNTNEIVYSSAGQRDTTIYDDPSGNMRTESFTSGLRDPQFMSFYCTIKEGGTSGEKNMYHPGDELIYIVDGQLTITIAGETQELHSGDSLSFKSHLPHRWFNSGNSEAKVIWTLSPFTTI